MSYLLFSGHDYYPYGGAQDLQGRFDSVDEAIAAYNPDMGEWAHVLCLDTLKTVRDLNYGEWVQFAESNEQ